MRIILASASPRRRDLLAQIGLEYEVLPSGAEEKPAKALPEEAVQELAMQKAEEIYRRICGQEREEFIVIGADTVVAFEGEIMGKPKDKEDARRMLGLLQGKVHQVYTGVAFCGKEKTGQMFRNVFYEKTDVSMYPMNEDEIAEYIETGEPMDKAGAYGIQGRCAAHIEKINGDYNNVVGLPVGRLYQELKKYKSEHFSDIR